MFTVSFSHRFMWPIHTETQRFISWNMKRATEQREIFTSSVSVLRSPLHDAKSKYISSNQTARYEGNRGDLSTLCVWIGFKQYQSVYLDWNREVKGLCRIQPHVGHSGCRWSWMCFETWKTIPLRAVYRGMRASRHIWLQLHEILFTRMTSCGFW